MEEKGKREFVKIPQRLITSARYREISAEAKLLYALMLDRTSLSQKNNWYDKEGQLYIYYTLDEVQRTISCGHDKASKLMAELDDRQGVGLIHRKKQGLGKPARIYVRLVDDEETQGGKTEVQSADMQRPGWRQYSVPNCGKKDGNQMDINQTDDRHTDLSSFPITPYALENLDINRYKVMEEIKANVDYEILRQEYPDGEIDNLLELIVDVVNSPNPIIRIGGENLPVETVRQRFLRLDRFHIEYVVDSSKHTTSDIHNMYGYMLTALYHAPLTMDAYYDAAVRHDFS